MGPQRPFGRLARSGCQSRRWLGRSGWSRLVLAATVCLIAGLCAEVAVADLGPVPPKVLVAENTAGKAFILAPHGHATISKSQAVSDALRKAPWSACATGISLARVDRKRFPSNGGKLVWLVSVHANERVEPIGPPTVKHVQPANFFLVAVSARTGRFILASDGHSRKLPPWKKAAPSGCVTRG